jgi:hypothetical protein
MHICYHTFSSIVMCTVVANTFLAVLTDCVFVLHSVEVIAYMFALKLQCPDKVSYTACQLQYMHAGTARIHAHSVAWRRQYQIALYIVAVCIYNSMQLIEL